jgi:hypothetical protein
MINHKALSHKEKNTEKLYMKTAQYLSMDKNVGANCRFHVTTLLYQQ